MHTKPVCHILGGSTREVDGYYMFTYKLFTSSCTSQVILTFNFIVLHHLDLADPQLRFWKTGSQMNSISRCKKSSVMNYLVLVVRVGWGKMGQNMGIFQIKLLYFSLYSKSLNLNHLVFTYDL